MKMKLVISGMSNEKSKLSAQKNMEAPTNDELETFYRAINKAKCKPSILKITEPYSQMFTLPWLQQSILNH